MVKENVHPTSRAVLTLLQKYGYTHYDSKRKLVVLEYSRLQAERTLSEVHQWIIDLGFGSAAVAILGQLQDALFANGFKPLSEKQKSAETRGLLDRYGARLFDV